MISVKLKIRANKYGVYFCSQLSENICLKWGYLSKV